MKDRDLRRAWAWTNQLLPHTRSTPSWMTVDDLAPLLFVTNNGPGQSSGPLLPNH